jgi:hypothetical protein
MVEVTQADRDCEKAVLDTMFRGDVEPGSIAAAHVARERDGMIAWLRELVAQAERRGTISLLTGIADAFERGEDKETDRG